MASSDTIFALSTGRLPSGVAIVRMSGPSVRFTFETIFGRVPKPRHAEFGTFAFEGQALDIGLVLYFPGPASVTGEDCGEFHLHGSVAVVQAVMRVLAGIAGLRPAEAGEFTQRAFLNGKMDLTGVEALSDLIGAETEEQRRQALVNVGGRQREMYLSWRERILALRARLEADLDFSDQDDVEETNAGACAGTVAELVSEIEAHISLFRSAEIIRTGYSVVIIGAPNSGKSSLLNTLAQREVAIVSDEAGTTRDLVTVALNIGGLKVNLTDTAGLREDAGRIEAIGISKARATASGADLVLKLVDLSDPVDVDFEADVPVVRVGSKVDLSIRQGVPIDISLSTLTGEGISPLLGLLETRLREQVSLFAETVPTRERHIRHLNAVIRALRSALSLSETELIAEEFRLAAAELGRIVGLTDSEELLGEIFSRFCIGK